ncbi:MAG: RHS repeat protein [Clostridia bacterium]|nr:RHS repeat protein [Clostridia bacterium]
MKKIISFVLASVLLMSLTYAQADQSFMVTMEKGNASSVVEQDLTSETDYSDLEVTVTRAKGELTQVIYKGLLGGYDDGAWNNIDFAELNVLVILRWDGVNDDTIYIVPNFSADVTENAQKTTNTNNDTEGNLLGDAVDFTITSNIKINNVDVGENGIRIVDNANMNCTFNARNNSTKDETISLILATYTTQKILHQVKYSSIEVKAGTSENIQLVYQFDAENEDSARLMLWNSFSKMIPIKATIDFTQTSGINAYYYNADNRLLQVDKMNGKSILFTYDKMGNMLGKTIRE